MSDDIDWGYLMDDECPKCGSALEEGDYDFYCPDVLFCAFHIGKERMEEIKNNLRNEYDSDPGEYKPD